MKPILAFVTSSAGNSFYFIYENIHLKLVDLVFVLNTLAYSGSDCYLTCNSYSSTDKRLAYIIVTIRNIYCSQQWYNQVAVFTMDERIVKISLVFKTQCRPIVKLYTRTQVCSQRQYEITSGDL